MIISIVTRQIHVILSNTTRSIQPSRIQDVDNVVSIVSVYIYAHVPVESTYLSVARYGHDPTENTITLQRIRCWLYFGDKVMVSQPSTLNWGVTS